MSGLPSFVVTAAVVLGLLRIVHVGVPLVFPETRPGPVDVADMAEAGRLLGFAPLAPAYRPAALGARPARMFVQFSPRPTFHIVWENDGQYLSVTHRKGGPTPDHPPTARPFDGVPDALWWTDGARSHLVLSRDSSWIEIETSLPARELRRFVDTLSTQ